MDSTENIRSISRSRMPSESGRSTSRSVRSSGGPGRSISRGTRTRMETQNKLQSLIQMKKRDHIMEKSVYTTQTTSPYTSNELRWDMSVKQGVITGVTRFIMPEIYTQIPSAFEIDMTYNPTGLSGADNMPKIKEAEIILDEQPVYLNLDITFLHPDTNLMTTIRRQMFKKESMPNGYASYQIVGGEKSIPAVRNVSFRVTKSGEKERIPLLNPMIIVNKYLSQYTKHIMNINSEQLPLITDTQYNYSVGIAVPNKDVISLFVNISIADTAV